MRKITKQSGQGDQNNHNRLRTFRGNANRLVATAMNWYQAWIIASQEDLTCNLNSSTQWPPRLCHTMNSRCEWLSGLASCAQAGSNGRIEGTAKLNSLIL